MRTFEDIEKEFLEAKEVSDSIRKELDKALTKTNALYAEMKHFKMANGMYHPMSDLKQYAGKIVRNIELIEKDNNGTLETKLMYDDEIFKVDEHGHLDYSSYDYGVMHYDENEKAYIYAYHGRETKHNFVGYLSIEVDSEDE